MRNEKDRRQQHLQIIAILGQAQDQALADLVGPLSAAEKADLETHPNLRYENGWTLAPETAAALLSDLKTKDPARHRQLHKACLTYLLEKVDDTIDENRLIQLFETLTNPLLRTDPVQLVPFIEQLSAVPWQMPVNAQTCAFYQAVILRQQGQIEDAITRFKKLLSLPQLDEKIKGRALNSLAICYTINGRWQDAYTHYEASLAHWNALDDGFNQAKVRLNLGIVAYKLRNYSAALENFNHAQSQFELFGAADLIPTAQSELGIVYRDMGEWEKALAIFGRLASRFEADGELEGAGLMFLNMGEIQLFQGALETAASNLNRALNLLKTPTYKVDVHLHLGLLYLALNDLDQADAMFNAARHYSEEMGRDESMPEVYYHLGQVARLKGELKQARLYLETAVSFIENSHQPGGQEELKISLLGRWQQVFEALVLLCLAQDDIQTAFNWAERARARAFAQALQADQPTAAATAADIQNRLTVDTVVLSYFTTGVLENDVPMLRQISNENPLRPHLLLPAETICFVITSAQIEVKPCHLDPNLFSANSPRGFDVSRLLKPAVLKRLYTTLCQIDNLNLSQQAITIIPHGPLHRVPFTAVFAAGQGALPNLTYAPSGSLLQPRQKSRPSNSQSGLAIGYNGLRGGAALRYTEAEVRYVGQLLDGAAWTGNEAKRALLTQAVTDKAWLHFACHGFFDVQNPMDSYLETGADERITAVEILSTWQLTAHLVTLSACQTGVSQVLRGDEPMGLIRAFLYAGAKAVLITQWEVDDLATALLMGRFYEMVAAHVEMPLSRALVTAQEWLKSATTPMLVEQASHMALEISGDDRLEGAKDAAPFSDPTHWAGFAIVGGG